VRSRAIYRATNPVHWPDERDKSRGYAHLFVSRFLRLDFIIAPPHINIVRYFYKREFFMQISDAPIDNLQERLLQTLSNILIELNALQVLANKEPAESGIDVEAMRQGLTTLERMTREVLAEVRAANADLSLAELEGVTLAEALSRLVEETAETLGLASRISFSGVDERGLPEEQALPAPAERLLFLAAREALYQVAQHTGARRLRLTLNYGRDDVQMSIEDDGINAGSQAAEPEMAEARDTPAPPFDTVAPEDSTHGEGAAALMHDIGNRIERLGGTLEITAGERGTRVEVHLPYHAHYRGTETAALPLAGGGDQVRILIVDSQAVTRAGLHRLLDSYAGLQVVGEAADGVQAVSEMLELGPQVVLMDAQLSDGQSLEALRQIKQLNRDTKVLLLAAQAREEYLYEILRAGADGYILKDVAPDELAQSVRAVARGELLLQPELAGKLISRFGAYGRGEARRDALTARELEVLRLLARGLRNKEIAARLFVSERTVNFHLANIYQKLNVSGRTEALSRALEQGLITA
jgi:DNA-binding NarL/FixJ family response regulator